MNVLMVTCNADVLREGSSAFKELVELSVGVNRLMVIVLNRHADAAEARQVGGSLWLFPTNSWLRIFHIQDALRSISEEIFYRNRLQADVIMADDPGIAAIVAYIASYRYKRPLHVRIAYNPFTWSYARYSASNMIRCICARSILRCAHALSVTGESIRETLIHIDPRLSDRISVIPRRYDFEAIDADALKGDDLHVKYTGFRAIFLVVAPLRRDQNIRIAIEMLARLSKSYRMMGLVIVGKGLGKNLLRWQAKRMGVSDKVIFEPPHADLYSYYRSATALIVPTQKGEFGSIIEDAAAVGCVIIASRQAGMAPFLISHGVNGFLCDPDSVDGFANAADKIVRDTPALAQMRQAIRQSMQDRMESNKGNSMELHKIAWRTAIDIGANS